MFEKTIVDIKLVKEINENKKIDVIENNYEEICQSFKKHFEIEIISDKKRILQN